MWSTALTFLGVIASINAIPTSNSRLRYRQTDTTDPSNTTDTTDWCAIAYNATMSTSYRAFPASYALKCLQSLPYDQAIAEATIDTVSKMFNQFFAPESYYLQSPNSMVDVAIDIPGTLANIKQGIMNQSYSYFDYQYAITELVRSLNDGNLLILTLLTRSGHTAYVDPCSSGFYVRFPLPMVLLSPDGQSTPSVYVSPDMALLTIGHPKQ